MDKYKKVTNFIRKQFQPEGFIPLHIPTFGGNEKKYLNECIDSTFVSSVGNFVTQFEELTADFVGAKYAVAVVNGTAALHIALMLAGVKPQDEVITQALTFVATANAIKHANAEPVFVDVDKDTMGMSPAALKKWLYTNTKSATSNQRPATINKITGKRIAAIVPMHTFGHPCRINEIVEIANKYNIPVVEDSAESLGSYYREKHTGTFGKLGVFSYNGNKTITTGGGGMIVTDDEELAKLAKHITTTAKVPHPYEYVHNMIGYNYRLTNLAAALGVAQMEQLPIFLEKKRYLADKYKSFFANLSVDFISEPENSVSNYWLNAIQFENCEQRDKFLEFTNKNGIMTRPIWELMNRLTIFKHCQTGDLPNSEWLVDRIVNIPSSII